MKDLAAASEKEQAEFINSFDLILSDVDGVIWLQWAHFEENPECIDTLKKIGKRVVYVSNNATKTVDVYFEQLQKAGFAQNKDDIVTPTLAIISYLKKANFSKNIYLLGMESLQKDLEDAGFTVVEQAPNKIEPGLLPFVKASIGDLAKNVGAVIADADVNTNCIMLQRAALHLRDPNVLFLKGGGDIELPFKDGIKFIGPGRYHKVLEDATQRTGISLAKPSSDFNKFIVEKYNITDPQKVLFVGDSIPEDMTFATNSGYRKLLVLSGLTSKEMVTNWSYPEELKPDYYVDRLGRLGEIIKKNSLLNKKL